MNTQISLQKIITATGWTQEELAGKLSVSFPTLNSWINGKSTPRKNADQKIQDLYHSVVGVDSIEASELATIKKSASSLKLSVKEIVNSKHKLDKLTLYLTYHTNTIEGSTMTLSDVEDVIFDNKVLSNRTAIEQAEARNHQATLHWLLDTLIREGKSFQIDEQLVRDIHVRLMNGIVSDAGIFRRHSVRIMGSRVALANWAKIQNLLSNLFQGQNDTPRDLVAGLAKFHADFEQIHPFSDGNGRTGRLLMLAQALSHGVTPPVIEKERKQAYYKYLELAQTKDRYDNLELFIAQSIIYTDSLLSES